MWPSHAPSTLMAGAIHCSELASSPNLSVYKDACSTPTLDSPPLVHKHFLAGKYDLTAAGLEGSCSPTSSASTEILSREGSPNLGLSQFRSWATGSPLSEAMAALETLSCQLDTRKGELDERQSSLTTLEAQLAWRRTGLDTQEAKLKLGEHELETRKSRLATQVGALDARTEELDAREKAIEAREANLKERRRETKGARGRATAARECVGYARSGAGSAGGRSGQAPKRAGDPRTVQPTSFGVEGSHAFPAVAVP